MMCRWNLSLVAWMVMIFDVHKSILEGCSLIELSHLTPIEDNPPYWYRRVSWKNETPSYPRCELWTNESINQQEAGSRKEDYNLQQQQQQQQWIVIKWSVTSMRSSLGLGEILKQCYRWGSDFHFPVVKTSWLIVWFLCTDQLLVLQRILFQHSSNDGWIETRPCHGPQIHSKPRWIIYFIAVIFYFWMMNMVFRQRKHCRPLQAFVWGKGADGQLGLGDKR